MLCYGNTIRLIQTEKAVNRKQADGEAGGRVTAAGLAFGLVDIFPDCNSGQCGLSAGQRGLVEP